MPIQNEIETIAMSDESRLSFLQIGRAFPTEAEVIDSPSVTPWAFEIVRMFIATSEGELDAELTIDGVPIEMVAIDTDGVVSGGSDSLCHAQVGPLLEYAPAATDFPIVPVRGKLQCELTGLSTTVENLNCTLWVRKVRSNDNGLE